jgi:DNA (cytosine-5)-methyltransferase 1
LGLDGYIRAGVAGHVRQHRGDFAMRYGSVCSGIEAATQAWHGLGWEPAFFSEIDAFPRAVLEHHHPDVPVHGDFTTIKEDEYGTIDVLVGGTPCQSFSIAGLRGGMDDERGNLALEFIRLAQRKRPQWVVWENVPGVLSSNGGRDFGSFLGALAEIGYGFAYRVLDAQFFGVAQRRRRVFVVGYLGDWRRAAAVLFERESLLGNPAPSREEGEKVAPAVTTGPPFSRTGNERVECEAIVPVSKTLTAHGRRNDPETENFVVPSNLSVRRLTPTECERLQGFPQSFTQIPYRNKPAEKCPDGPRYKALGNSMAVPVMRWIGERIQAVEALDDSEL